MTTFYIQHANRLLVVAVPPPSSPSPSKQTTGRKEALNGVLVALNPPISTSSGAVLDALSTLRNMEGPSAAGVAVDGEEDALRHAIHGRIAVALFAQAFDTFLTEASDAETEAEWWSDIERSRWNTAVYLLQTLPGRLHHLFQVIVNKLQVLDIPLRPSVFTPSSLRELFPTPSSFRPGAFTIALFPHLRTNPHAFSLASSATPQGGRAGARGVASGLRLWLSAVRAAATAPLDLTKQECGLKKKALQKLRDERAEALGLIADMQKQLENVIEAETRDEESLARIIASLETVTQGGARPPSISLFDSLNSLATSTLPSHKSEHAHRIRVDALLRPPRLTLLWPRLILLPPLILYGIRTAYASRQSLAVTADAVLETIDRFWHDWLLEPLREVVKTVRAGSDERVIVSAKGVDADIESLERMALSLARDKLNYSAEQLSALAADIRLGDLTPVQEIYEEDIKSPLRSAISGTLLRSVFIQVQKAKVDIDNALAGIDKLLKSQELTFAFVGVAPAFALVYLLGGAVKNVLLGGSKTGRYGGRKGRAGAWNAMRRIERLLIGVDQAQSGMQAANSSVIPPLTSGLLLLSLAHLRRYAERSLPAGSRLREGFLEDVTDLEDPALGRMEKMRIVDRMWRTWGTVLGWPGIAAL